MTLAADAGPAKTAVFSPKTVLTLVLVALFAFSAFAVLATYAPELRGGEDGGAHALSKSAVGFAGAAALLRAEGTPVVVSRAPDLKRTEAALVILTPPPGADAADLQRLASDNPTLVVLPKWQAAPDPLQPGWVRKLGLGFGGDAATRMLAKLAKATAIANREDVRPAALRLAPGIRATTPEGQPFDFGVQRTGPIDRLQTLDGRDWEPLVVDEVGHAVLAASRTHKNIYVLADPDLLNTQGLANLDTARAATALVEVLRADRRGVLFDVTLHGFGRSRNLGRLLLDPPMLGATLCAVAAALLMGAHALVRFGPTPPSERAFALGARALVDNSAGLVRMADREAELAQPYAALTEALVARATGGRAGGGRDPAERLDRLERQRRITSNRRTLAELTRAVKTPADLLAAARRWRDWKLEMTRDRR
ncbi:DUF4350 domain-containing protein [Phenylobacterium sp.]|uniref:DUF4350 domain-containing protein n=1 Tax=Phenylobacterium sp. TaxID=1871053 RepID=UPI002F41D51A